MTYLGIDWAESALEPPQERSNNVILQCADLELWEPRTGVIFDAIVFNEVLYYCSSPGTIVSKYLNYLSIDGIIAVSMYIPPRKTSWHPKVQRAWKALDQLRIVTLDEILVRHVPTNRRWRIRIYSQGKS
jgi:trans-aconitate methyltransferase